MALPAPTLLSYLLRPSAYLHRKSIEFWLAGGLAAPFYVLFIAGAAHLSEWQTRRLSRFVACSSRLGHGSSNSIPQTLIVPAIISLVLFLTITYVLLPFYRRYRARYAQYIPIESLQSHTDSLRARLAHPAAAWRSWRAAWLQQVRDGREDSIRDIDVEDGEETGEELGDVNEQLRQALAGHAAAAARTMSHARRLSRE